MLGLALLSGLIWRWEYIYCTSQTLKWYKSQFLSDCQPYLNVYIGLNWNKKVGK